MENFETPVKAASMLQQIAGRHGIGRDIHVSDTIIGIKRTGLAVRLKEITSRLEKHVLTNSSLTGKIILYIL